MTGPRETPVEAVLFDLGDTLIHFETSNARVLLNSISSAAHAQLSEMGFRPPSLGAYRRGLAWRLGAAWLASRLAGREVELVSAVQRFHARLGIPFGYEVAADVVASTLVPSMKRHTRVDEHAIQMLQRLQAAGVAKMGLVSNTPFPGFAIDAYLEQAGLLPYFQARVYSSDVGYRKPHPRIFQQALKLLDLHPGRALYVGDRVDKDIDGASGAGMRTVLFVHEGTTFRGKSKPDHEIRSLLDLVELVKPEATSCVQS